MTKAKAAVLGILLLMLAGVSYAQYIPPGQIDYYSHMARRTILCGMVGFTPPAIIDFYSHGVELVTKLPKGEPAVGAIFNGKVDDTMKLAQRLGFEGSGKGDRVQVTYQGDNAYEFQVPSLEQSKVFVFRDGRFKPK